MRVPGAGIRVGRPCHLSCSHAGGGAAQGVALPHPIGGAGPDCYDSLMQAQGRTICHLHEQAAAMRGAALCVPAAQNLKP